MDANRLRWPSWIGVVADDLEGQRVYYRDTLGFRETYAGDDWVHFDVDGYLFEVIRREAVPQYEARRYQVGFTVDDIASAREELIGRGAEAISEIEGGPPSTNYWCYFRDPEGNVFEITQWVTGPGRNKDLLTLQGIGWEGDLEEMRRSRIEEP